MPPIDDPFHPIRPDERPDPPPEEPTIPQPEPEPDPPSQWNPDFDEGLIPNPEPDIEIPIGEGEDEDNWFLLGDPNTLTEKFGTYGGVGAKCRSYSKNWSDMATVPYWMEGTANGVMNGATLILETPNVTDQWLTITDSVFGVVNENSYVEMDIVYAVSEGAAPYYLNDTSLAFSVCLEGGDSLSASLSGGAVSGFSIVKNGMERINYSEFAVANTAWDQCSVTITITKSVHCSYEDESIQDDEEEQSGDTDAILPSWEQADSWGLLGFIVLVLLGGFVLNTTGRKEDG